MIALAIAWVIVGTVTFLGMLMEYMEGSVARSMPPMSKRDAIELPGALALMLLGWPIALWRSGQ